MDNYDTQAVFEIGREIQERCKKGGAQDKHPESKDGAAFKKRMRSEYFKAYNAARRESSKEYQRRPEQKAKAKISQARYREKIKLLGLPTRKRIRIPKIRKPKKPLLTSEDKKKRYEKYRLENLEHIKEVQRKWRESNRERERLRAIQYRSDNPEKSKDSTARYEATHPEKAKLRGQKRRAVQLRASIGNMGVIARWQTGWRKKKKVMCYWCKSNFPGKTCHADHIVPLSRGGPHSIENLCIACPPCNHRKHSKPAAEWAAKLLQPTLL